MSASVRLTGARLGSFGFMAAAVAAAMAGPEVANAQTEEVIVTGSRVSRSGFDSPQPVTAIGADQIDLAAEGRIAQHDLCRYRDQDEGDGDVR